MEEGVVNKMVDKAKSKCCWRKTVFKNIATVVSFIHLVVELSCVFYYMWIVYSHGPFPRLGLGYQETGGELFLLLVFSIQASLSLAVFSSLIQNDRQTLQTVLVGQYILGWLHLILLALLADTFVVNSAEQILVHILFELISAVINWYSFAVVFSYFGWSEREQQTLGPGQGPKGGQAGGVWVVV